MYDIYGVCWLKIKGKPKSAEASPEEEHKRWEEFKEKINRINIGLD